MTLRGAVTSPLWGEVASLSERVRGLSAIRMARCPLTLSLSPPGRGDGYGEAEGGTP